MRAAGVVLALVGATVLVSAEAQAQGRPDSLTMTCAQAQALVQQRGAIVVGTGPHVYDRYVADRRWCMPTQRNATAFVATRDNRNCFIGYTCREATPFDVWR